MSCLVEQVEQAITLRRLFRQDEPILVAVSGGLDSMVLLRVLRELSATNGWRLTVGHLNHQIRGRSSDADERLVRRTAKELGLKLVVERVDVPEFGRAQGLSLEMAARKVRHEFLAQTAASLGIASIALGHHADDQLELFFLRLMRGSGSEGLAGMKWQNPSPMRPEIQLVRPLLDCSKAALYQYVAERKVKFREDASNACVDILRNRIRHQLLPLLREKFQPALATTLLRTMDVFGAEAQFIGTTARKWLARKDGASFAELPVAVQRRCVQLQLLDLGVLPNFELIEHLRLFKDKPVSARIPPQEERDARAEPDWRNLVRERDGTVHFCSASAPSFKPESIKLDLVKNRGNTVFGGLKVAWRILAPARPNRFKSPPGQEFFDADKVGRQIWLRHWRPGDRFQPIGMGEPVKLQDLFVNQKVPRGRRHNLVVAVSADQQLFWVEGLRISERFKLAKDTVRRLHWRWRKS